MGYLDQLSGTMITLMNYNPLDTTGHETAQQQHVQTPRCQIQLFGRSPGKCVTLGSFSIFQLSTETKPNLNESMNLSLINLTSI